MDYLPTKLFSLKASKNHDEKWLQELLASNESLLGLGEIQHIESERRQLNGGRLDLMFQDESEETRYCVEVQLGATDEAHIIRTIEYWDNERSRNPHINHVAVIVAEDITTRFLNVISLFNKSIPLIAIQLNAHEVDGALVITCVPVLDIAQNIGWDDDNTSARIATDRSYWEKKGSARSLRIADDFLDLIKKITNDNQLELKFNKHYVGIARSGVADNFIWMTPKKEALNIHFKIPYSDELRERIERSLDFMSYTHIYKAWKIKVTESDLSENTADLENLIRLAGKLEKIAID